MYLWERAQLDAERDAARLLLTSRAPDVPSTPMDLVRARFGRSSQDRALRTSHRRHRWAILFIGLRVNVIKGSLTNIASCAVTD